MWRGESAVVEKRDVMCMQHLSIKVIRSAHVHFRNAECVRKRKSVTEYSTTKINDRHDISA